MCNIKEAGKDILKKQAADFRGDNVIIENACLKWLRSEINDFKEIEEKLKTATEFEVRPIIVEIQAKLFEATKLRAKVITHLALPDLSKK